MQIDPLVSLIEQLGVPRDEIPATEWHKIILKSRDSHTTGRRVTRCLVSSPRGHDVIWDRRRWLIWAGWARALEHMDHFCFQEVNARLPGLVPFATTAGGDLICIGKDETKTIMIYTEDWHIDWDQMHAVFDWGVEHLLKGIITLDPEVLCYL